MRTFGHVAVALLAVKLLVWYISPIELALVAFLALLPDIDHPSAPVGKLLAPLSRKIYSTLGHRRATHSLLFVFFVTNLFVINLHLYMLAWIALGSHLLCDMSTYMGVPLFWPSRKNFVIFGGPLFTGDMKEMLISVLSLIGVIFLCI